MANHHLLSPPLGDRQGVPNERDGGRWEEFGEEGVQRDRQTEEGGGGEEGTGNVSKDLRTLLEEFGREILRFFRAQSDIAYVCKRSFNVPETYLQIDTELVARYWQSALAPLEERSSSLSLPLLLGETVPGFTVKELRFESDAVKDWDVIPRVARVLSLGSMVKILRIDPTSHWDLLHLLAVMDALPRLEELYVEPHKYTDEQEDQLTGSVNGVATGTLLPPLRAQGVALNETKIRVLVVFGAVVTLSSLESIVRQCPLVEVLKFSQTMGYSQAMETKELPVSGSEFWPHLRVFCKRLREFHYSMLIKALTVSEIHAVHLALPRMHVTTNESVATEYAATRPAGDSAPSQPRTDPSTRRCPSILCITSRELGSIQDYIKTFKADWLSGLRFDRIRTGTSQPHQNTLHMILCACPNLIEFTALSVYFYLQDMDVNNLLVPDGSYRNPDDGLPKAAGHTSRRRFECTIINSIAEEQPSLPPPRRAVWACRNLKTLHISISKSNYSEYAGHRFSLLIFGYLSLVCTRLEELSIRSDRMVLDDESGLCLLGRLKYLEWLQLHSLPILGYLDVAWLRRRKFGSGFFNVDNGGGQKPLEQETLLDRIVAGVRHPWGIEGVHVVDPTAYLKKLPPLLSFYERKPFLTVDGVDLGTVGRPDSLVAYVMDTNRDLMADASIDDWNRDAVCLPRLELLYFRQSWDNKQETADAESFLRTQ
ncbi:hypothetical protein BG015_008601 [Linnemannia schmuckeri]|uniref:Uncharacterized protein n=1 Tax=Linnemannia schmuckeri TaxID=64567 RepID=A0A9P5S9G9_9FUNG|nr:hypothetical protein BG015_008601 [Linnemannia schmuckeri]